jgi:hypothetical protein
MGINKRKIFDRLNEMYDSGWFCVRSEDMSDHANAKETEDNMLKDELANFWITMGTLFQNRAFQNYVENQSNYQEIKKTLDTCCAEYAHLCLTEDDDATLMEMIKKLDNLCGYEMSALYWCGINDARMSLHGDNGKNIMLV